MKAIHVLSQIIHDVDMNPVFQVQMSQNLTAFQDILGGCERLLRAPIPLSYTRWVLPPRWGRAFAPPD